MTVIRVYTDVAKEQTRQFGGLTYPKISAASARLLILHQNKIGTTEGTINFK